MGIDWYVALAYFVVLITLLLQAAVCLVFFQKKSVPSWLMIVGTVMSLAGTIANTIVFRGYVSAIIGTILVEWLPRIGMVVFLVGVMLLRSRYRDAARRITQLERTFASHQAQLDSHTSDPIS